MPVMRWSTTADEVELPAIVKPESNARVGARGRQRKGERHVAVVGDDDGLGAVGTGSSDIGCLQRIECWRVSEIELHYLVVTGIGDEHIAAAVDFARPYGVLKPLPEVTTVGDAGIAPLTARISFTLLVMSSEKKMSPAASTAESGRIDGVGQRYHGSVTTRSRDLLDRVVVVIGDEDVPTAVDRDACGFMESAPQHPDRGGSCGDAAISSPRSRTDTHFRPGLRRRRRHCRPRRRRRANLRRC